MGKRSVSPHAGLPSSQEGLFITWCLLLPKESISAIRTERGIAGKVAARNGILAIRWRLPSGVKIDMGFRADNRGEYLSWLRSWPEGVEE